MKPILLLLSAILSALPLSAHKGHDHSTMPLVTVDPAHVTPSTQWAGKRAAYLGDSMTDPNNTSATLHYWNFLDSLMGIRPEVHARSGYRWNGIYDKAVELSRACPPDSLDAIFIWAGTNDFNHSVPLGTFFTEQYDSVSVNGIMTRRLHRTPCMTDSTLCGNINRTLHFLRTHYPKAQIIVLTPIHRAYAKFSAKNEQPSELYANDLDLWIEDYVDTIIRGARLWSVPVIDLYAESGLMPLLDEHTLYFHDPSTDRLHPSDPGHYRLARTIQARLLALPSSF